MTRLWLLMFLYWAWSPLCLPSGVSFIGTPQECQKTPFVPGYNLGGEGFDIVKMERKGASVIDTETWNLGNGTCKLTRNSYMNRQKQKIPVSVADWRTITQCMLKVSNIIHDSVESFVNDSMSVSSDWKSGLNLTGDPTADFVPIYGGSQSKESVFAMKKSKEDRYSFLRHSVNCNLYRYRMSTTASLSREFEMAVNSLPPYSNKTESSYRNLIDIYGTHHITQVFLGGEIKAITAVRTCEVTMKGLLVTEVDDCLTVEASAGFAHPDSIRAMMKYCVAKRKKLSIPSFSSVFNERYTEVNGGSIDGADILFQGQSATSVYNKWLKSLKKIPDVVHYNLKPLHTILPTGHPARNGLKLEVERYIKKNAVLKKCSETCKVGQRSSKRDPCACVCHANQNIASNCCPVGKGLATLTVFGLYAQGLYGDMCSKTDGSVEVRYRNQVKRTAIIVNNDFPKWKETFKFGPIKIDKTTKLTFTVYDEDTYWNSNKLGSCSFNLYSGNVTDSCMLNHGTLFFSYTAECAPSLGGQQCQNYVPSPMSRSLAKVFYTRNRVLAGASRGSHFQSVWWRPAVKNDERYML